MKPLAGKAGQKNGIDELHIQNTVILPPPPIYAIRFGILL